MGLYSPTMARAALVAINDLGVDLHSHVNLTAALLELAGSITAYDATYVAVAALLDAPLLTCDQRLARSAERWCEVVLAA
jgi:predicted nucleic acid-binding protein